MYTSYWPPWTTEDPVPNPQTQEKSQIFALRGVCLHAWPRSICQAQQVQGDQRNKTLALPSGSITDGETDPGWHWQGCDRGGTETPEAFSIVRWWRPEELAEVCQELQQNDPMCVCGHPEGDRWTPFNDMHQERLGRIKRKFWANRSGPVNL